MIKSRLLVHSVDLLVSVDGREGITTTTFPNLKNVRMEKMLSYKAVKGGDLLLGNMLLFIDYVQSSVELLNIKITDKVTFENETFDVVGVNPQYALKNTPHHLEVVLK